MKNVKKKVFEDFLIDRFSNLKCNCNIYSILISDPNPSQATQRNKTPDPQPCYRKCVLPSKYRTVPGTVTGTLKIKFIALFLSRL
jgi:hypothetical protein